jgi:hypothetical protein
VAWPARSPDLSPLDFFLGGQMYGETYQTVPETEEILINRINAAAAIVTVKMLENVQQNIQRRVHACLNRRARRRTAAEE